MSDRRFTEEEAAEILKQAVELQHSDTSVIAPVAGLTLAELQDIGREVGVSPEVIQQAARRIEPAAAPMRSFLGFPLGVGKTVELGRTLTEDEWERLVVDLRETFDARGVVRSEGSLRSWRNGNLQVLLEPGSSGQRIRFRTLNANARGLMLGGLGVFTAGLVLVITALVTSATGDRGLDAALLTLTGAGATMFGLGALRLPGWARTRLHQMEDISTRLLSHISNG